MALFDWARVRLRAYIVLCKYPETSRWLYGVPSHMHGLLALTVQRAAYKRVGELPADARSAEAGSELVSFYINPMGVVTPVFTVLKCGVF